MSMSLTLAGFTPTTQALLFAVLVGGALLVLVGLSLSNPLLWRMGMRNILRHRAQTLIMLCGLALFSAFLTASFGLQDSFSHSIVVDRQAKVGDVDESVTGPFTQDQVENALAQIRRQATVQAATAVYFNPLAAQLQVQRTGITRTNQYILAVPPDFDQVYGVLRDNQGHPISIANLRADEVLLSHAAAMALDIKVGDRVLITLNGQNAVLVATVRAILSNDPTVTGGELAVDASYPEMVLPLGTLQQFSRQSSRQSLLPNTICIKNTGLGESQAALAFLERYFHVPTDTHAATPTRFQSTVIHPLQPGLTEDERWNPVAGKADFIASSAARQFDLLLPVLTGLLACAGILLLVLLSLFLAADRRVELGIARAIGLQRHHLVQTLLIECCGYSLLAALPGVLLGMGILELELLMFSNLPALSFRSATEVPLSLWISWQNVLTVVCLGILTALVTTGLAAIWISQSNIVTAIRNLDELPRPTNLKELLRELTTAPTMARRIAAGLHLLLALLVRGPLCLLVGILFLRLGESLTIDWLEQLAMVILIGGGGLLLIWLCNIFHLPGSLGRWLGGTLIGLGWLVYGLQAGTGMILLVFTATSLPGQVELSDLLLSLVLSLLVPLVGMVVLVMMNSDSLATALHLIIRQMRGLAPVSRPSMAYPLTFRFRTGVATSLLSLVLFLVILVMTNNLGIGQQAADTSQPSAVQLITMQNAYTTSITRFLVAYLVIGVVFSALIIGVIASRAVVERRQQIGMLRALGFSRALVRRSFLLETSFVVILSLVISATLAWWLVSQIAHATSKGFAIPLLPTLGLLLGCWLVSFVCTFVPAQRASSILPAEALRYE